MRITISDQSGARREGIVLAMDVDSMRVALRNAEDVSELRFANGRWRLEDGLPVQLESVLAPPAYDWRPFEAHLSVACAN